MRALVTGGAGFIGTWLVRELLSGGARVRVLERERADLTSLEGLSVDILSGDIRSRSDLSRAFNGQDHLFHLAGNPNLWVYPRSEFDSVNHLGTRAVLREAQRIGIQRAVFTSTESILVPRQRDPSAFVSESDRPSLGDMIGPYCRSKLLAEREALRAAREGLHIVVVNPTLPIGPGDRNLTPPGRMIRAFLRRELPGYVEATLNCVDVRDVAAGHVLACLHGQVGRRYILGNTNITIGAFFDLLGEVSGVRPPQLRVPFPIALAFAFAAEFAADWITRKPPLASVTGLLLSRRGMSFDSARAREELGFAPRPLRESLEAAVRWFRAREAEEARGLLLKA